MVFRPLPHRQSNGDGHKRPRESRRDHHRIHRLSLLTILFHFRVTRTGSEVEQSNMRWDIVRLRVGLNTTYKLHTFFKYYANNYGRKK